MIVGQRVTISATANGAPVGAGNVVAFLITSAADQGAIDVRGRIVVQADDGSFVFAAPERVRVNVPDQLARQVERIEEQAAQPDEPGHRAHVRDVQNRRDGRGASTRPKCPTHGLAARSRKVDGGLYCPASGPDGYCSWSYAPEKAKVTA